MPWVCRLQSAALSQKLNGELHFFIFKSSNMVHVFVVYFLDPWNCVIQTKKNQIWCDACKLCHVSVVTRWTEGVHTGHLVHNSSHTTTGKMTYGRGNCCLWLGMLTQTCRMAEVAEVGLKTCTWLFFFFL